MMRLDDIYKKLYELEKLGGLRVLTLHVLRNGPKNGAEIMDSIEKHREMIREMLIYKEDSKHPIDKALKPSSGAIYPLLKKLVAEGLILKMNDGKYELTETGIQTDYNIMGHLKIPFNKPIERGEIAIDTALNEIDSYISFLTDFKKEKLQSKKENIKKLIEKLTELEDSLK